MLPELSGRPYPLRARSVRLSALLGSLEGLALPRRDGVVPVPCRVTTNDEVPAFRWATADDIIELALLIHAGTCGGRRA
jgi:hypothetical protein